MDGGMALDVVDTGHDALFRARADMPVSVHEIKN
jgi:hypothetical protein